MEARKFVVNNPARDSKLSVSVTSVNAALEPLKVLKVLIEGLPANSRTGLWLTNFKGVPVARTLSPFDLVYLDKEYRVLHAVELSKDGEFAPFKGRPASALVLPPGSLTQSQTREGDQLEFEASAPEVEQPKAIAPLAPSATESAAVVVPSTEPSAGFAPSEHFFSSLSPSTAPAEPEVKQEVKQPEPTISGAPTSGLGAPVEAAHPAVPMQDPPVAKPEPLPPRATRTTQDFFTPGAKAIAPVEEAPQKTEPIPEQPHTVSPANEPSYSLQITQPSTAREKARAETTPGMPISADGAISAPQEAPAAPVPYRRRPPSSTEKYSWKVRLLRWLFPHLVIQEVDEPTDRRRADRQSLPGLVAYYFTGGSPEPQHISNISVTGFYLETDERWMPGTVVRMTLQRLGSKGDDPADTITVNSRIVRWGSDGEGFEFILTDLED